MGLNVNKVLYNAQGVDLSSVEKVSGEILKSANNGVKGIDYSKFNRATLGVDLYSSRTNVEIQRQIAAIQAGLYAKAVNVAKLNSNAAANLYSASNVQKNVGLAQSVSSSELTPVKAIEEAPRTIRLFETSDKNSQSQNGFNPFASTKEEK